MQLRFSFFYLAIRNNFLQFGDCYIGQSKTLNLRITNHSQTDCFRFKWPDNVCLKFSPQVGHLHPAASKNILVTFGSSDLVSFKEEIIQCLAYKIVFSKPLAEVPDWDDRIKVVKWVDAAPPPPPPPPPSVAPTEVYVIAITAVCSDNWLLDRQSDKIYICCMNYNALFSENAVVTSAVKTSLILLFVPL